MRAASNILATPVQFRLPPLVTIETFQRGLLPELEAVWVDVFPGHGD
jgi:hypothetical protein